MTSTLKKTLAGTLAAVTLGIAVAASSTPASAQWRGGWGWGGAGFATGLAVGALAARPYYYPPYAYGPGYGYPPPPGYGPAYPAYYGGCRIVRRSTYDANGYFNGYRNVQVCR